MNYGKKPLYHYRPEKGWINDPNGLVYFKGWYHIFYQHAPHFERPWKEPMHWGHARTKDFLHFEELEPALLPDQPYDKDGCWSGTALVKDDVLYLFYASIRRDEETGKLSQRVSCAFSEDGFHFTKYDGNPVISAYPEDGGPDFRDPAATAIDGKYYIVMASGHPETKTANLLLYESEDLFNWTYRGVMREWADSLFTECPSFMKTDAGYLLAASVCSEAKRYFSVMYGTFADGKYTIVSSGEPDKGPDQYAGQVFKDPKGRTLLITWIPGWRYAGYREKDIGCMSVPRELTCEDGTVRAFPAEEVRHLLKKEDPALKRTDTGFIIERAGREPVIYEGSVNSLDLIRDEYVLEVFVDHGKAVYTVLL